MTAEFIVAVHAAVYLNHKKDYMSSEEIAENVCTNPARIRKIMHKLKTAEIIKVRSGTAGGYAISKDAKSLTLYDILIAVEENFVNVKWRSGDDCAECPISRNMKPIMDNIFDDLDECAKNKLKAVTIYDIDKQIFG